MSEFWRLRLFSSGIEPASWKKSLVSFLLLHLRSKPFIQDLLRAPQGLLCLGAIGRVHHCLGLAPFDPTGEIFLLLFVRFALRCIECVDHNVRDALCRVRFRETRETIEQVACLQAPTHKRTAMPDIFRCGLEGALETE